LAKPEPTGRHVCDNATPLDPFMTVLGACNWVLMKTKAQLRTVRRVAITKMPGTRRRVTAGLAETTARIGVHKRLAVVVGLC